LLLVKRNRLQPTFVCDLYASTTRLLVVALSDRRYTVDEHFSEQHSGIEEGCIVQDDGRPA
jgi:hypothetical protein